MARALIRPYRNEDERGWVVCRTLSFLDTAYYDDVRRSKEHYERESIELVADVDGHQLRASLPWRRVTELVVAGELSRAADIVAEMEGPEFEAHARLLAAKQLIELGRYEQANEQLEKALAFYRPVSATRFIREAEALLAGERLHT